MRRLALVAPAAVLAGALLIGGAAHARGGGSGALGVRGGPGFAARQARLAGLRPDVGLARGALARDRIVPGARLGGALANRAELARAGVPVRAPFAFGYASSVRGGLGGRFGARAGGRFGEQGFPWNWGWGSLGAGWWAAGWDFPWDWAGFSGPCYQWVYPPDAAPYCAPPYPGNS